MNDDLTIEILNSPNEILKYLQIGISLPIWPEFHKYILHDIKYFNAKSLILKESGSPLGNVLIYSDNKDILYFGYFGVINHNKNRLSFLLNELINYAKKNNYKSIRGPINIPTVIFGWGFMEEGSSESLFAGKPVNPPIYQQTFFEKGFITLFIEKTWEGNYIKINPFKLKIYDYSDYNFFFPKDINEMMQLKEEFLRINAENLPDYSKITPSVENLFDNYLDYVFTYGYNFMIILVKHLPTDSIIACGTCLPNPFRKDKNGKYDSAVAYSWAIDVKHRKKGLSLLIYSAFSTEGWKNNLKYASSPTGGNESERFAKIAKLINMKIRRTHLILELKL